MFMINKPYVYLSWQSRSLTSTHNKNLITKACAKYYSILPKRFAIIDNYAFESNGY